LYFSWLYDINPPMEEVSVFFPIFVILIFIKNEGQ